MSMPTDEFKLDPDFDPESELDPDPDSLEVYLDPEPEELSLLLLGVN